MNREAKRKWAQAFYVLYAGREIAKKGPKGPGQPYVDVPRRLKGLPLPPSWWRQSLSVNLQDRRSVPARVRVLLWGREERVQRGGIRGRKPARAAEGGRRLPGVGRKEKRKEPRPKQAFLICI
jgi:hypothetical protein